MDTMFSLNTPIHSRKASLPFCLTSPTTAKTANKQKTLYASTCTGVETEEQVFVSPSAAWMAPSGLRIQWKSSDLLSMSPAPNTHSQSSFAEHSAELLAAAHFMLLL